MSSKAIVGDWKWRLNVRLSELGFDNLTQFLKSVPGIPYEGLPSVLGTGVVAPICIEQLQFDEAAKTGKLREAAMDAMVRELRSQLPNGWINDRSKVAGAGGFFISKLSRIGSIFRQKAISVWEALLALDPNAGWLPSTVDDSFVKQAFDTGWIEEEGSHSSN